MSTQDNNVNVNPAVAEEELSEEKLNEQRLIRREKLKKLQEAGRNPFLQETWDVTAHSMDIKDNFVAMEDQEVSCRWPYHGLQKNGKDGLCGHSG